MYELKFSRQAAKDYRRISSARARLIQDSLRLLAKNPLYHPQVKRLAGKDVYYRLRSSDYRVLLSIDHENRIIIVIAIGTRGGVYKKSRLK